MAVHNRLLPKYRRGLRMIGTIENTVDGDRIKRIVKAKAVFHGNRWKQVNTFNRSW